MAKIEPKTDAANLALRVAAILGVMYGFGFLLMPHALFQLSGDPGVPTNPGWVRWAGGFVLGIAIGPWLASEGWVKEQQPFIAGLAAAFTLSGLALLYSIVSGEYAGAAWFIWIPIVVLVVLAPALWWLATR
jgi:ribose/xylose/arabinose/galactoside ABC-type transport system permease subunit